MIELTLKQIVALAARMDTPMNRYDLADFKQAVENAKYCIDTWYPPKKD